MFQCKIILNNASQLSQLEQERECLALRSDLKRMVMNGELYTLISLSLGLGLLLLFIQVVI